MSEKSQPISAPETSALGMEAPPEAGMLVTLVRGMRRRCPRCGRGAMYEKRMTLHDRCTACGLTLVRNHGDPWAFLLIIDRLFFIVPLVVAIYLGLFAGHGGWIGVVFTGIAVLVLYTTPHRYGLCVALDYLTRVYWGDLATRPVEQAGGDAERERRSP